MRMPSVALWAYLAEIKFLYWLGSSETPAGVSELHFHGRGRYGKLHLTLKLHLTGRGRYGQPPSHGTRSPAGSCRGATPAAMPLAKAIGPAPRDCTLHEKHYKKAPAMRMHSGCLEGLCGDAQWVVPMSTARSASFFTTASTAFSRPRAIWCRSMLGVPRGLLTTCSMA